MTRIMVVDDEAFFRTSFETYVNWAALGCEVVASASNGQEALALLDVAIPDLVFLDIQMPVMTGLQFLEAMQRRKKKVRVIVLSSFHEFEYVRQAMRLGAVDYIHKSEMGDELLARIVAEWREAGNAEQTDANAPDISLTPHTYLQKLLHDLDFDADQNECSRPSLRITSINLFVLALRFRHYPALCNRYQGKEHLLYQGVQALMLEMLSGQEELECLFYDKRTLCVIKSFSTAVSDRDMRNGLAYLAQKCVSGLHRFFNLEMSVGISGCHQSFGSLSQALQEAFTAGMIEFTDVRGVVRYYTDLKDIRLVEHIATDALCVEMESVLRHSKKILPLLKQAFYADDPRAVISPSAAVTAAKNVVCHFVENETVRHKLFETFEMTESLAELLEQAADALEHYAAALQPGWESGGPISAAAQAYMREHYADSALSLEQIAKEIKMNASYLSRVFRKETGVTVSDYLNRVRIQQALILLLNTHQMVYQIAYAVGYSNVEHFNRTFKKATGRSPGFYRGEKTP